MLRYMLDTNLCIHVMRNPDSLVKEKFRRRGGEMAISTITWHELVHGAERSQRPEYQLQLAEDLASRLDVLDFDRSAADHSGHIHAALARSGQVIGAYDMLIAGHARSLGLMVVTNNLREFRRVDGLLCENWV